jgi:hypothetical protein
VRLIDLPGYEAARDWVIDNQLGKRNVSPNQAAYLRGLRYNAEKAEHGGDRKSSPQSEDLKTSKRLAEVYGVSAGTIENNGQYAGAVDLIAENCGEASKAVTLRRQVAAAGPATHLT